MTMPLSHSRGSRWFPVAVQALVFLAGTDQTANVCHSSSAIAQDLQSHAVFLRRILAQLARADLIVAREGRDGGYRLARPPEQITLAAVYHAVTAPEPTNHAADCDDVPTPVQSVLDEIEAEAERRRLDVLCHMTLASVLERVAGTEQPS